LLAHDTSAHEHVIEIVVSDTGIGISPEQLKHLFQPFNQADNSTSRSFGGTGLGLAISKNIVELMGGTITAESQLGVGSTITFTMRLGEAEQSSEAGTENGAGTESGAGSDSLSDTLHPLQDHADKPAPTPGGMTCETVTKTAPARTVRTEAAPVARILDLSAYRILLGEDVEINREIVLALLEGTKVVIDCAVNGVEAVRMYEEAFKGATGGYDLILMDIQMPEMDGYDATRRIRSLEAQASAGSAHGMGGLQNTGRAHSTASPHGASNAHGAGGLQNAGSTHIPIIAMTANVFQDDIDQCLAVGMDDHIGKPIDLQRLLERLHHFLSC
jgi:CheY-like chemotaxis protein